MHTILKRSQKFLVPVVFVIAGCGGGAGDTGGNASAGTAAASRSAAGTSPVRLDMDAIFPPGAGRELVLNNCQSCHTFVPIVILQMDQNAWHRNSIDHRERVANLSDEDFKVIYDYLVDNFNPNRPVPELPKEMLESWTSY